MARIRQIACVLAVLVAGLTQAVPARSADADENLEKRALNLNNVTGEDPIKGHIVALVEDPDGTKKLLAVAVKLAEKNKTAFNYNGAYILARSAQELKDIEACKVFYKICADWGVKLRSTQRLTQSFGSLIDLLYENKQYADAEKICQEFLEVKDADPKVVALKSAVQRRMIQAIAKQGKAEQALKLADNYVKQRKEHWLAFELKAWVQRELGKTDDAAKTYEEVLTRIQKDDNLQNQDRAEFTENARYILSGVYVELNQIDKAAEHLKAILQVKPNDPTYNNDLGYIWADHDMNLEEAEKLVRKAIEEDRKRRKANPDLKPEEDKDNPAYIDSLGWVLYKQ
ncbi:MAG: tetratricopeptide repeat protein, partial [Gemmataceae bacterium]